MIYKIASLKIIKRKKKQTYSLNYYLKRNKKNIFKKINYKKNDYLETTHGLVFVYFKIKSFVCIFLVMGKKIKLKFSGGIFE